MFGPDPLGLHWPPFHQLPAGSVTGTTLSVGEPGSHSPFPIGDTNGQRQWGPMRSQCPTVGPAWPPQPYLWPCPLISQIYRPAQRLSTVELRPSDQAASPLVGSLAVISQWSAPHRLGRALCHKRCLICCRGFCTCLSRGTPGPQEVAPRLTLLADPQGPRQCPAIYFRLSDRPKSRGWSPLGDPVSSAETDLNCDVFTPSGWPFCFYVCLF